MPRKRLTSSSEKSISSGYRYNLHVKSLLEGGSNTEAYLNPYEVLFDVDKAIPKLTGRGAFERAGAALHEKALEEVRQRAAEWRVLYGRKKKGSSALPPQSPAAKNFKVTAVADASEGENT
jgi:hypothetical protein